MRERLYPIESGKPRLVESLVLFLDVLGWNEMAGAEDAQSHLENLYTALEIAREIHDGGGRYEVTTFTDNLVLGWPLRAGLEREALEWIFTEAAAY